MNVNSLCYLDHQMLVLMVTIVCTDVNLYMCCSTQERLSTVDYKIQSTIKYTLNS